MKTPLQRMKDEYGTKDKLVAAVMDSLGKSGKEKDGLQAKLQKQSNLKLFKLLARGKKA
jgi:hypothetical protein